MRVNRCKLGLKSVSSVVIDLSMFDKIVRKQADIFPILI